MTLFSDLKSRLRASPTLFLWCIVILNLLGFCIKSCQFVVQWWRGFSVVFICMAEAKMEFLMGLISVTLLPAVVEVGELEIIEKGDLWRKHLRLHREAHVHDFLTKFSYWRPSLLTRVWPHRWHLNPCFKEMFVLTFSLCYHTFSNPIFMALIKVTGKEYSSRHQTVGQWMFLSANNYRDAFNRVQAAAWPECNLAKLWMLVNTSLSQLCCRWGVKLFSQIISFLLWPVLILV